MPPAVERVARKGRQAPGRRGVGRNHTFKFRSSIFVAQRKSSSIKDFYDLQSELNEGAYGVVYKAIHKDSGAERAVKKIEKSKWCAEENQKILDEFNVLKGLDHPNILKMYELFEEEGHFYIVTDICKGGDLLDELEELDGDTGAFPEQDAAILMNQVLSSINYCHKNNFVHRDLKPENILLEQNKALNEVKLIDFGFAVPCDETTTMSEQKGTAAYMSPQAMMELPYGQKADVWAVGVIAYIVLAGFNPFEGHTDPETAVLVEMGEFELDIPEWDTISPEAKDFVNKCLAYEEKDRVTAAEALNHPWIRSCRSVMNSDFYKSSGVECQSAFHNLQKFHAHSKLKQATCTYIASQLVSKDEKETIDKLFQSMDTASNGKLGKNEVKVGYRSIFGKDLSDADVDDLFSNVDIKGDGIIEYSEFVVAAINEDILLRDENLKKAFFMFDRDSDGFITRGDLVKVMSSFGAVEGVIIDKIMNQIDTEDTGKIDFNQFRVGMFSTADLTQAPDVDNDDDEEEVPLDTPLRDSDDGASIASSKKVNAKPALMMPRRRSHVLENNIMKVQASSTKDGAKKVIRTTSGSSNLSNLTGGSDDGNSGNTPPLRRTMTPPPSNIRVNGGALSPVRVIRSAKKGVTRTKSGFMTQRAEPANHQVRGGRKPTATGVPKPKPDSISPAEKKPTKPTIITAEKPAAPLPSKAKPAALPPTKTKQPSPAKSKAQKKVSRALSESSGSSSSSSSSSSSGSSSSSSSSSSDDEESIKKGASAKKKATAAKPTPTPRVTPSPIESKPSRPCTVDSKPKQPNQSKTISSPVKLKPTPAAIARPSLTEPKPKPLAPPTEMKTQPETPVAAITDEMDKLAMTSAEERKKELTPGSNHSEGSAADAIELIKSRKKEKKKAGLGNLSDMLGGLPATKNLKKHQKPVNPMSSSMSVPAAPTQNSIRARQSSPPKIKTDAKSEKDEMDGSRPRRNSIQDRMNAFGGQGAVRRPSNPANSSPSTAKRISPGKVPTPSKGSTPTSPNGSARKEMQDDSYSSQNDRMSSASERIPATNLPAGLPDKSTRRNSLDTKEKEAEPPRTSLRDRMKLFEQNIKKNEDSGQKKKPLW